MQPRRSKPLALAAALVAALAVGTSARAQETHEVDLLSLSFSPDLLTIKKGDTVRWIWITGTHDVQSGSGGAFDGAFLSPGGPVGPPKTFEHTFDDAFLTAHPRPGNAYPYFCSVHFLFGMTGTIVVDTDAEADVRNGSGSNPASYSIVGRPVLGGTITLSVNASGTTGHTNSTILSFLRPDTVVLAGGQELLLDLTSPGGELLGLPLQGGDTHLPGIPVPADPALCGLRIATQGLHAGGTRPFALSNAIDLVFGAT